MANKSNLKIAAILLVLFALGMVAASQVWGGNPLAFDHGRVSKYALSEKCTPENYTKYDRNCYSHWDKINDQDTRQYILARDSAVEVVYDHRGKVISGYWCDPYTTFCSDDPSDFDIEHGYALGNADADGAKQLSPERKQQLANDPRHLYVTWKSSNRYKGARSLLEYLPSDLSFVSLYIHMRVVIAKDYDLDVPECELLFIQAAEKYSKHFEKGLHLRKIRDWVVENKAIFSHPCFKEGL